MRKSEFQSQYRRGLLAGIPIALGYAAVSFAFGIFAVGRGFMPLTAIIISFTAICSAGQFAGVELMSLLGSWLELIVTVFIINLRYALMSLALSQKLEALPAWKRMILAHGVTDEIFALAIQEEGELRFPFFLGLMTLPILGWTGGTAGGAILGELLPPQLNSALGIALYCMFIAIVIPPAKKDRQIRSAVLLAVLLSLLAAYAPPLRQIPFGWRVIACTLLASAIQAWRDVRGGRFAL